MLLDFLLWCSKLPRFRWLLLGCFSLVFNRLFGMQVVLAAWIIIFVSLMSFKSCILVRSSVALNWVDFEFVKCLLVCFYNCSPCCGSILQVLSEYALIDAFQNCFICISFLLWPSPMTLSLVVQLWRYERIHDYIWYVIPFLCRLISKPSFHTLSNAFCRSIHTACTAFCSWMQSSISCERRVTLSYAVIAPKSCLFGHQLLFCFKMVIKPLVNNSFKTFGDATGQTDWLVPSCLYPFCRLGS